MHPVRWRTRSGEGTSMTGYEIFLAAIVVLAVFIVFSGVKSVPQGYEWTVERFGR